MVTRSPPSGSPKLPSALFASPTLAPPQARRSKTALDAPSISIEDLTQPLTNVESTSPLPSPVPQVPTTGRPFATKPPQPKRSETVNTWDSGYRRRRGSAWHRRRSPQVHWRKKWDEHHYPWHRGRVLIVDCFSRDNSDDGKRKTLAYEMSSEVELREFYETGPGKQKVLGSNQHCLRVIHVQNCEWARDFLLRKFNINHRQDITGTNFGRWAIYDRPQRRAGKPVLNTKSFRNSRDPWRGVSRTGFGIDYLKCYHPHMIDEREDSTAKDFKLMGLNHWEEATEGDVNTIPAHGYDVYVQRLSVYVQRSEGPVSVSPDDDIKNPYTYGPEEWTGTERRGSQANGSVDGGAEKETMPLLESMDNGSTVIVFEASQSGDAEDTLVQARKEIEVRWRRLMQLLPREDIPLEDQITVELMNIVLRDLFKGLQQSWEKLISRCDEHVSILEDKIYENPADESRAPELWTNSSLWLKVEKLISLQQGIITEVQNNMRELAEDLEPHDRWLEHTGGEFKAIETMVQEQLVKPTANLSDLMYKSVGIRDARHSLQLGLSMWRLSWITFVFLPLTFMVGFFGMNVNTFQPPDGHFPSMKWYFVAAVPLMLAVVLFYFLFKRADQDKRRDPVERGAYEHIFQEFAEQHPKLWGRFGPRLHVKPKGMKSRLKWRLVTRWFDPAKTIAARRVTDIDEMSLWARFKRSLATRWLGQIDLEPGSSLAAAELGEAGADKSSRDEFGNFTELLGIPTGVTLVDADPNAAVRFRSSPKLRQILSGRRTRSSSGSRSRISGDRPQSPGSNVMVEEEKSDDDSSDREGEAAPSSSQRLEAARREHEERASTPAEKRPRARARTESAAQRTTQLLSVPSNIREHAP